MFQNILLTVFAVLIVWFLARLFPRREKNITGAFRDSFPASPFCAVSVYPPPAGCQAAKTIKGKSFLSNEAPHLPLEGCTAARCHCVYQHHADRRTSNAARRELGAESYFLSQGWGNRNRRLLAGRRGRDIYGDFRWAE